jgi:hypothetical protein
MRQSCISNKEGICTHESKHHSHYRADKFLVLHNNELSWNMFCATKNEACLSDFKLINPFRFQTKLNMMRRTT